MNVNTQHVYVVDNRIHIERKIHCSVSMIFCQKKILAVAFTSELNVLYTACMFCLLLLPCVASKQVWLFLGIHPFTFGIAVLLVTFDIWKIYFSRILYILYTYLLNVTDYKVVNSITVLSNFSYYYLG
jgi:hypothetical protein